MTDPKALALLRATYEGDPCFRRMGDDQERDR